MLDFPHMQHRNIVCVRRRHLEARELARGLGRLGRLRHAELLRAYLPSAWVREPFCGVALFFR